MFFLYVSTTIRNGKFELNGKLYEPTFATLKLMTGDSSPEEVDQVDLFLYKGETTVVGSDLLTTAKIDGCDDEMVFQKFKSGLRSGSKEQVRAYYEKFIKDNPRSYVSLYLADTYDVLCGDDVDSMMDMFNSLSSGVRNSRIGKSVEAAMQIRKDFYVGSQFKDFVLKDPSGNEVQLSNIKAKAIFIDFWASHCGPCRKESPHYKVMYEKYRDQGLEIVAYSTDTDPVAWRNAITKDGLPWINVIDQDDLAKKNYNVDAIPTNFLVDSNGKIYAAERHGEDMVKRIVELLAKSDD
jgi:peroxiredoxin